MIQCGEYGLVFLALASVELTGLPPSRLIAINAVQLVVALISNVFLLLNMTRRVRFAIAQPTTIVGW